MKTLLILALLGPLGGRSSCPPSGCSSAPMSFDIPQYSAPPVYYTQPAPVQYLEPAPVAAPAPKRVLKWHRIKYKGRVLSVLGVKVSEGVIDFKPEDQPEGWADQLVAVAEPEPTPKPASVDATVPIESAPKVLFDQSSFKNQPDPDPGPVGAAVPAKSTGNEPWRFNGVNSSQIGTQGLKAVGPEARAMVESIVEGKPSINDDSGKFSVSIIGPTDATAPVLEAFRSGPIAEQAGQLKVRAFAKSDPLVKDIGLVGDGAPDIVVQSPDGTVRLRLADFKLGGEGLKNELVRVGAVRKANASYDAKKDPGVEVAGDNLAAGAVGVLLFSGGVLVLASRKRKSRGR